MKPLSPHHSWPSFNIESVNHVGIRVSDKTRSVSFYENLGFQLLEDAGFDKGHPRNHEAP